MKEILDQSKQSIEAKKSELQTSTLATTFHKSAGKQIRISGLDAAHRKFKITLEDKFQYQLMLSR